MSRTHYDIELEHFLLKLLDQPDSDLALMASRFGVDKGRLSAELSRSLDRLKTGNARTPAINSLLLDALTRGWAYGSIEWGAGAIRTGFVVFAMVAEEDLSRVVFEFSREMRRSIRRLCGVVSPTFGGIGRRSARGSGGGGDGRPKSHRRPSHFHVLSEGGQRVLRRFSVRKPACGDTGVHVFRDYDTLQPAWCFPKKSKRPWRHAIFCWP